MRSRIFVLALAVASCERDPSERDAAVSSEGPSTAPRAAWHGYVATHWLPGPDHPRRRGDRQARAALEAGCPSCHAAEAEHWQASQHAGAWSDPAFQAAFAMEPAPFCQGCHAPEATSDEALADADDLGSRWAAGTGVGCVTCHVEPGEARIWTAGEQLERDRERGCVLPIARSPAFAGPQACAACHEFAFPEPHPDGRARLMQSTVAEHAASTMAARSCSSCHMPSERSHAFPGAYDLDMLRRSLEIDAQREPDALVLALRPGVVGHAVPTGDLFRRLEIRLLVVDADGHERLLDRRWLGRRFDARPRADGSVQYEEIADERVGAGGQVIRFELGPAERDQTLRWRVAHQRVAHPKADGEGAWVEGELEFASGVVPRIEEAALRPVAMTGDCREGAPMGELSAYARTVATIQKNDSGTVRVRTCAVWPAEDLRNVLGTVAAGQKVPVYGPVKHELFSAGIGYVVPLIDSAGVRCRGYISGTVIDQLDATKVGSAGDGLPLPDASGAWRGPCLLP